MRSDAPSQSSHTKLAESALAVTPTYGLAAIQQFDKLPYVQLTTQAGGDSSYQRNTAPPDNGNRDWGNFRYSAGTENVMLDQKGPGTIYRLWATGFAQTDWIKVYFDGASTPRINVAMKDFFSGNTSPFLSPLAGNDAAYSGGFVNYLPLPFASSIRITTSMTGWYNVGYHKYAPDTVVTSWTGSEDSAAARAMWNNAGTDPKPSVANTVTTTGTSILGAGATQTLLDVNGPRSIWSVRVKIPGVNTAITTPATDNGRAFKGYSQFRVALNSGNQGVLLKRRTDYGIADQRAGVYVNNAYVGDWIDPGSDGANRWRDSSFRIPSSFTAGKSSVTIRIKFVSSSIDWNEFRYWVYSTVNGTDTQTDTLDVGDSSNESSHGYVVNTATWNGSRTYTYPPAGTADDGRAHKGASQFRMAISPTNTSVTLTRRMDYGIPDQKATVTVDGVAAGTWLDSGSNGVNRWRDSSFIIPSNLTAGKSSITVRIQFASAGIDWNEFGYTAYSTTPSGTTQTDYLDVAKTASESAHNYTISAQTWTGSQSYYYDTVDLLNNLSLKIAWDSEATPSVNAPLGSLFGIGQFGAPQTTMRALPVGIDASGYLYLYFPMPFAVRGAIQLTNNRTAALAGVAYELKHTPFTDSFTNVGYFRTNFRSETPATVGADTLLLDTGGCGSYVGSTVSLQGQDAGRGYLEGDERIYVDGSATPAIHGTGTEDYFNGGFYFSNGVYSKPLSGNPVHAVTNGLDQTSAYRFFAQDAVTFRRHLWVSLEHGAYNETSNSAWVLAYYYQQPSSHLALTDTLDAGNTASEAGHAYTIDTPTWNGTRTYTYAGADNTVNVTDDGRAHKGFSQFTMALDPNNQGAILRRRLDYSGANQLAKVFVDGVAVGDWYDAGNDAFHSWRDSDFQIPAARTASKSSITVKIQYTSAAVDWNEFTYWLYSITP